MVWVGVCNGLRHCWAFSQQDFQETTVLKHRHMPTTTIVPPSTLAPSLWGKGDPPASIMGKWPHPPGKTKMGLRPWHQMCDINAVEFQNALQVARETNSAEHTLEQHVIINRMNKHEKALACANTIPPFVILTSIAKELADVMQVWTLNESACPPVVRQLPDCTLHLHDVDFYIWLRKISPKEVSLQASILEAIRLARLVQDIDEWLIQSKRQHHWKSAHHSS